MSKTIDEVNRHNMSIFMPCEFHDYQVVDRELKICRECGVYSYWPESGVLEHGEGQEAWENP